jgi:hypothetical protein
MREPRWRGRVSAMRPHSPTDQSKTARDRIEMVFIRITRWRTGNVRLSVAHRQAYRTRTRKGRCRPDRSRRVLDGYAEDEVTEAPGEPPVPDPETARFELRDELVCGETILPWVL